MNELKFLTFFFVFLELAIVDHQPRAATVIATEDTQVAFLEVKAFERLLGPCLDIMKRHAEGYNQEEEK